MNKITLIALFSVLITCATAQTNRIVVKANSQSIELKWYSGTLLFKTPIDLYRSENNGTWIKINTQPFRLGAVQPDATALQQDPELRQFMDLVQSAKKPEGPALLITTLKSFKSTPFCQFIGNYYEDSNVSATNSYKYRIVAVGGNYEQFLAESESITAGSLRAQLPVDSIYFKAGFKSVQFGWKPETMRYYGVNIYRSTSPDSLGTLITKDPILVSKVSDEKGNMVFPEYFFEDSKLEEKHTYYYTLSGLDFFGSEIQRAAHVVVQIKDNTLPKAPESLQKSIYGKRVNLRWYYGIKDDDFAGYHVYQATFNGQDSLHYERVTSSPLDFADSSFSVTVPAFGLYFFRVATVDESGNEAFSPEAIADIIDNEPPQPPLNLIVTSDTARLVISWDPNPETDILGYRIYRSVKNDLNALTLLGSDILKEPLFIDSLPANAQNKFTYAVLAVDTSLNESKLSAPAGNNMIDVLPPKQPFLKLVSFVEGNNQIEWVKNTELDLAGYHLYRFTDQDSTRQRLNNELIPGDISRFTDRNVLNGKTYHYILVAVDTKNNISAPSNQVSVRLKETTEASAYKVSISKVKYDKAGNTVKITCKSNVQEGAYSYILFRRTTGKEFQMISKKGDQLQFRDSDVKPGETFDYQIRMYDEKGRVTRSEVVTFIIPKKRSKTN